MNRNFLLETAGQIKPVSQSAVDEYYQKMDDLTFAINKKMLERPDIKDLVGENNIIMMKDNHSNHARFIASLLQNYIPEVFVDTVLWVFRAYRSHGFNTTYWAAQLNTWFDVLNENLTSNTYKEVIPYYIWMQTNIPVFVKVSDEKLSDEFSMH